MNGELSHGLAALVTSGNRILRSDTMNPVLLRGVNRSGLEYSEPNADGFLSAAQINQDEIREIVSGWRSNIVRIPFNEDWCLNGRGAFPAEAYLASLDQVISWAAEMGAYTILDLHWLDVETAYGTTYDPALGRATNHVPPTPNEQTIVLWRSLAARYQNEPAVLFDLLNEPHSALADDPNPLNLISSDGHVVTSNGTLFPAEDWVKWASVLIATIREIKPDGLILVGGADWAFDLSQIWIDAQNIVYSTHIYANRKQRALGKALGRYREVPIFVGEWGGTDQDLQFGTNLAAELRRLELGWTAWSWTDFPRLVVPPRAPDFKPTPFGALVRNELIPFGL
jgi:aryl-phospho-beta-D-glucosidase BglC (GH1 family)